MKKMISQFAMEFTGDTGIGAYVHGEKTTKEQERAEQQFEDCLMRIFPDLPSGSECGACEALRDEIRSEAYELVTAYCQAETEKAIRFGAQLMKELLEGEHENGRHENL